MKTTVNFSEFTDAFNNIRPDNFSYYGLKVLFDHLEEYEDGTGDELELDVIAFCCEYSEYYNIKEYNDNYNTEHENHEEIDETTVIPINDESFIIQNH